MLKYIQVFVALTVSSILFAQPNTEVYLFDLKIDGNNIQVSNPVNISNNVGYDNQPSFLPDGSAVLFAASRGGQTDIKKYSLTDDTNSWLTDTEGSEYSPTPTPDGDTYTSILLEKNGRQLLWRYPLSGGEGDIAVPYLKIGYHAWLDMHTIYAFVLGNPPSLQEIKTHTQEALFLGANYGRSIHNVGGEVAVVDKAIVPWRIKLYNRTSGTFTEVITTPEGSEDMAWIGTNMILMGSGANLFVHQLGTDNWAEVSNLEEYNLTGITRLAVSPKQNKLAVVVTQ